jgi:hypothetical protein
MLLNVLPPLTAALSTMVSGIKIRKCRGILLAAALLLGPGLFSGTPGLSAAPADPAPGVGEKTKALMLIRHQGDPGRDEAILSVIAFTEEAVGQALDSVGLETFDRITPEGNTGDIPLERIRELCREAEADWAYTVFTDFRGDRLYWRFSIYDPGDDIIRASDAFFVFLHAGAYRDMIENSADRLAKNWQKSFPTQRFDGFYSVTEGQQFTSPQEGVRVLFGSDQGLDGGVIEEGRLTAPFIRFTVGDPLYGTVMKEGYWPKSFTLPKGITKDAVKLPLLQKRTRHSVGFRTEFRGLYYNGAHMEYRFYMLPDRFFLNSGFTFWRENTPLSQEQEALHGELRLSPGVYLLPKVDSDFRIAAGTGVSLVFTGGGYNFLADPLWISGEYHFSRWALAAGVRLPSILGYTRDIFQENKVAGGMLLSAGVMLKW